MKTYLVQIRFIRDRHGHKEVFSIEEGEIKDIIKKFQGDVKLRFFKMNEVVEEDLE